MVIDGNSLVKANDSLVIAGNNLVIAGNSLVIATHPSTPVVPHWMSCVVGDPGPSPKP